MGLSESLITVSGATGLTTASRATTCLALAVRRTQGLTTPPGGALARRAMLAHRSLPTGRSQARPNSTPPECFAVRARRRIEAAGVIFIDENGEGPGVRLRKNLV
jgi:hypothetical protein